MLTVNNVLGIREFTYRYNEPISVRYVVLDDVLLRELNDKYYPFARPFEIQAVPLEVFDEYKGVIRFRDTKVFDAPLKQATRKVYEGLKEIVMYRMLAGDDRYVVREDTLANMEGSR